MKLQDSILPNYFSYISETWHPYPIYPYNFVNRNSKTLVITIGDSWTFGADIYPDDFKYKQERLNKIYGNIIASELTADFLSLGQSGTCNLYIISKIIELDKIIPTLEYEKIIIICTFTEACRSIDGYFDKTNDYVSWFNNQHFDSIDKFNSIIEYHNSLYQDTLVNLIKKYSHVELIVGTNFVEPVGMHKEISVLPKSWTQVYSEKIIKQEYTGECFIMSHWIFDKLPDIITKFKPSIDQQLLKQWMIDLINIALERKKLVSDHRYFRGISHPLASGHRVWANYILENLK